MNNQPTMEQMIADNVAKSISQLLAPVFQILNEQIKCIDANDDIAYPASLIAEMTGNSAGAIHQWFDNGKLKNVAEKGTIKKAKFSQFKHLVKKKVK